MYPNEQETIDFATIRFSDEYESEQAFSMESFETSLDGSTLKLDFTTSSVTSLGNDGMPHESSGSFMDICGEFTLTAELDGVPLASLDRVTIKPYASFHSMWEMFDELKRLAGEGDDDGTTPKPYVEYGVMGQSYLGYDMPYLIVARDSASVKKWLDLSEKAEETGTAVLDTLKNSGDEEGEGENGQFFPECYLIPLDAENQVNLQAAFEMIEYLTRNDVKVSIADAPVTADGKTLPAGTAVVSMYQAKRSVANAALYEGIVTNSWDISNDAIGAFNYTRGFDMVTCVKSAEYDAMKEALGLTLTYDTLQPFLKENAVSRFTGEEGGDVIISNASESSTAAVNSLLNSGKQVGMITEGSYKGYFTVTKNGI